ncbi:MAG: response regulator [Gammaproteobacteria bacterium]|nr:response regulator [Gammaproteobacteria bacterium]
MSEDAFSILLVEDNRLIAFQLSNELKSLGYEITIASSGDEAIRAANTGNPDLILMDVNLNEERDGVEIMQTIHNENGFIPNIFLTGYSKEELSSRVKKVSPVAIIEKPVNSTVLQKKIKELVCGK